MINDAGKHEVKKCYRPVRLSAGEEAPAGSPAMAVRA